MKLITLNILSSLSNLSSFSGLSSLSSLSNLNRLPILHKFSRMSVLNNFPRVNNMLYINLFDNYDLFLLGSVTLETISTICISKTNKNKLWFLPVYLGYFISFYLFPKCLDKYELSIAYTLWCGFGIITTTIADVLIFKQLLTMRKILGSLIIIIGIKTLK